MAAPPKKGEGVGHGALSASDSLPCPPPPTHTLSLPLEAMRHVEGGEGVPPRPPPFGDGCPSPDLQGSVWVGGGGGGGLGLWYGGSGECVTQGG